MRIGIAVEGTRGDVAPMLELGSALRRAGHEVAISCAPGFRAQAQARGLRFVAASADVHAFMAANAGALGAGGLRTLHAFDRFARQHAALHFEAALRVARESDRLIAAGVQIGAASAAELCGIPYRYVAYCPALFPSAEHPPFFLPWQRLPRWLNRLAWRGLLPPVARALGRRIDRERARIGLPPIGGEVHPHLHGERPVVAADAGLAPLPADLAVACETLPALHPADGPPLPEKLADFLGSGPPPVYIGFGSMSDADPARTTRTLLAAIEQLGGRALIGGGWAGLGAAALPENVLQVSEVSHAVLFARCAAVVHHGGAGTTTTAARAGVPQLVVPHLADQFYWAERAHRAGLAPEPLPRARLAAEPLAASLRAILDSEWLRARAAREGRALRLALASAPAPEHVFTR